MKYVVVLVFLCAPLMSQVISDCKAAEQLMLDPATVRSDMKELDDANLKFQLRTAVGCISSKSATKVQLRKAAILSYMVQDEQKDRLARSAAAASAEYDRAEPAAKDGPRYISEQPSAPTATRGPMAYTPSRNYFESPIEPIAIPKPQKTCVATSTPLGQSVVTGVNCY